MSERCQARFTVDGRACAVDCEPRELLSDVLRHRLGVRGVHVGCEHGVCGACTVLLDGTSVRSCLLLAVQADGADVRTVESLAGDHGLHPLQQAFSEHHALQCGFCTPGMLMVASELLRDHPEPSEQQVREGMSGNLCRCTGYDDIVRAVVAAGRSLAAGEPPGRGAAP